MRSSAFNSELIAAATGVAFIRFNGNALEIGSRNVFEKLGDENIHKSRKKNVRDAGIQDPLAGSKLFGSFGFPFESRNVSFFK